MNDASDTNFRLLIALESASRKLRTAQTYSADWSAEAISHGAAMRAARDYIADRLGLRNVYTDKLVNEALFAAGRLSPGTTQRE